MAEIRISGLTAIENGNNYDALKRILPEADTLQVKTILKIATKTGDVGTTNKYHTDVPPSVVFIEELLGEKVSTSFLRDIESEDEDGNKVTKQVLIKEGFKYPEDGSDCIDITKDIIDNILGLKDNFSLTETQINNTISFMIPYINKQDQTSVGKSVESMITYLQDRVKGCNSTDIATKMEAEKVYKLLIEDSINLATTEFSNTRTDILQWDIPTVVENFAPSEDKEAYGKEGYLETIEGVNVRSAYYQMGRISDMINTVKYLCKKSSIALGLTVEKLTFNPDWKVDGKIELPEDFDRFAKELKDRKFRHIYRNWISKPSSKSTIFAFQTEASKQKDGLVNPTKYQVGYTQINVSKSPNSKYVKFKSVVETGKVNSHPDFVIICENYPKAPDISDSVAAMSYLDPGTEIYNAIAQQKELKKEVYKLFAILNKDTERKCVKKLNKSLIFEESVKSFNNALNRVENINCQDVENHPQLNKTWLEKLIYFYPTVIEDFKDLFVGIMGFEDPSAKSEKVNLDALDLGTQPEVQPTPQPEVQPTPQPEVATQPVSPQPEVQPTLQQPQTQMSTQSVEPGLGGLGANLAGGLTPQA